MLKRNLTVQPTRNNTHMMFAERIEGWLGAGFKTRTTQLKMRRMMREGKHDELQLEITIYTNTEKRTREEFGSITIPADKIDEFIKASQEQR